MVSDRDRYAADHVSAGREALARGAWKDAAAEFEQALALDETPEALEGLGMAASQLDDPATAQEVRQIAYFLYQKTNKWAGEARVATWLALGYSAMDLDNPDVNLWLGRAHEALNGHEAESEMGWLVLAEAKITAARGDPAPARRMALQAARIGRQLELIELEREALALARTTAPGASDTETSGRSGLPRWLIFALVVLVMMLVGGLVLLRATGGAV